MAKDRVDGSAKRSSDFDASVCPWQIDSNVVNGRSLTTIVADDVVQAVQRWCLGSFSVASEEGVFASDTVGRLDRT